MKPHFVSFFLLTVSHWCLFSVSLAWKPIVGTTFSTSYKIQQSHPGDATSAKTLRIGASSAESAEFITSVQPQPESSRKILNGITDSSASITTAPIRTLSTHTTIFDADDFDYNRDLFANGVFKEDQCAVRKYAFNYDGIVEYESDLPEMNQFTICFWTRYTNHSGDHVALTYSAKDEPREIQFWISNSQNSSFISMAIKGQQVYRLNYPLRVRQWHHQCSSWNGKTGEWQIWLKAERVGRGFHNALVGHKIPAKGKLYSGGPSATGKLSQGLHFEVTLVQVYRIALSAGKAHRDHKHHHVHHFNYEGQEVSTTTRAPPAVNRPLPMHSLLASGQIPNRVRINLAQPRQQQQLLQQQQQLAAQQTLAGDNTIFPLPEQQQAATIHTNFVNGQFNTGSRLLTQQLLGHGSQESVAGELQPHNTHEFSTLHNPANVQFIDETETRIFFKRQAKANDTGLKPNVLRKRDASSGSVTAAAKARSVQKRGLVLLDDGSIVDDALTGSDFKYDGLAEFGGQQFKHDLTLKMNIEDEISVHDREPAEEEVKAVMSLCSVCDVEPFQGAIVFAWKDAKEYMNNALKGHSVGGCANF